MCGYIDRDDPWDPSGQRMCSFPINHMGAVLPKAYCNRTGSSSRRMALVATSNHKDDTDKNKLKLGVFPAYCEPSSV